MKDNFKKAKRIRGTNALRQNTICINGCCYGKENTPDKGDYVKYCGQEFWELISGDDDLYVEIIKPLGKATKKRTEKFGEEYAKVINLFTAEFTKDFCSTDGGIDWEKLVRFNSGKNK